jgi:hypothetical protein
MYFAGVYVLDDFTTCVRCVTGRAFGREKLRFWSHPIIFMDLSTIRQPYRFGLRHVTRTALGQKIYVLTIVTF